RDPARPCRPVLHIAGEVTPTEQKSLQQFFTARGWNVRLPAVEPNSLDVQVQLVDRPTPLRPGGREWPLQVTADALQTDSVLERLLRRDEVQKRRRLMAGLERLFKHAAGRTFRRGSGYWVAPHFWFIPGLTRDTPEDDLDLDRSTILSGIIG